MRRVFFFIVILMIAGTNNAVSLNLTSQVGLLKYELNKWEKSKKKQEDQALKPAIEANIGYLENEIHLKIKKYEAHLEKIKEAIQNVQDYFPNDYSDSGSSADYQEQSKKFSQKQWKKFYDTQEKIETLNDLLLTIEQWKIKLMN